MRPLKLTMTAFGPYKDREVVDFGALNGHRLFVVSGNTGAGKTSIFDAICFALYGSASGEDRSDSRMLRSHFADDGVFTSVDFEFELKGRAYRVFRQLAHVKAGNKSATGDRYELYALGRDGEMPLTDRFIVSQVDDKLRELIGLTKEQFSQIVMLPQGEFRKLLTSETENKEEILRRIFRTGLYKLVGDRLGEKRRERQQICNDLSGRLDYLIDSVRDALSGREDSALTAVFAQEHCNAYQVQEALEAEIAHYAGRMEAERLRLREETVRFQEETAAFHQAQSVSEQFALLERKREERGRLEERADEFRAKADRLAQAEHAVHLQPYERQNAEAAEDCARKSRLREQAAAANVAAEKALETAAGVHAREEARSGEREQAVRDLERLQGMLPTVRELDARQRRVAALLKETAELSERSAAIVKELDQAQTERAALAARVKELEERVQRLPELTERLLRLRELAKAMQGTIQLSARMVKEEAALRQQRDAFGLADGRYAAMENRWVEGQAGLLASHLHDGEACPVCGSAEHPRKAAATGDFPTKEELETLRRERSAREKALLEAEAALAASREQLEERRHQLRELGVKPEGLEEQYERLKATGSELAGREERLRAEQGGLAPLKQQLETAEGRLEMMRGHKETAVAAQHDRQSAHATERALYEQALSALPDDMRSLAKLERRIAETEARRGMLEGEWKRAQASFREASERGVGAAAALAGADAALSEATAARDRARQSYADALAQAGFGGEEAYRAAKLDEAARTALKREIEAYHASLAALAAQIADMAAALAGKERHDLDAWRLRLQERERAIDAVRSAHAQAEQLHARGVRSRSDIAEAEREWQEAERGFRMVKDLYDVIRGDNEQKISFERYLQIEFLEQIIIAANERLRPMSGGQFYLVRSDRMEKRGKQSGLGFDIYDNYTGQLRDVKTLSGGEKFNASLCLALGMADVIQAYEGGISLETMFIDEGFGSLDEESLAKAIDTLIDLQKSGRMIGVISHVQELKQAIPAVLEVIKTKEGCSHTAFHIGTPFSS